MLSWLLLFGTSLIGGSLNAVAGGGTFLTFPSLIFAGVLPVNANATSTVALWPGQWASVAAYRKEVVKHGGHMVSILATASVLGGLLGSVLLLKTPQATFVRLIPYLLLSATVLFAFGRQVTSRVMRWTRPADGDARGRPYAAIWIAQFIMAIYGGYFGGGLGILMLAAFVALGIDNLQEANALKTLLAACINGVAVVVFIVSGIVYWPAALLMLVGAVLGGYGAASVARRLNPNMLRAFVILVGLTMTVLFWMRS